MKENGVNWLNDKGSCNVIEGSPSVATKLTVNFNGNNARVKIGNNVEFINCNLYLGSNATIEIGDGSRIRGSFLVQNGCSVVIGKALRCNSYLNISTYGETSVLIGNDCLVAQATIRTSDMHPIYDLDSGERINDCANVVIGDHVWLGQDAYIGKGVTVSSGSVVGACAVVVKDIPENCVCAGNPARVVRAGIRWEKSFVNKK